MADETTKTYTIRTLSDLKLIPTDRLDAFFAELKQALIFCQGADTTAEAFANGVHPDLHAQIGLGEFVWHDDDSTAMTPHMDGVPLLTIPGERAAEFTALSSKVAQSLREANHA